MTYKLPYAYTFWYKISDDARTEYVTIVAYSPKQARYFFLENGYHHMADYSTIPCDINRMNCHMKAGTILGEGVTLW